MAIAVGEVLGAERRCITIDAQSLRATRVCPRNDLCKTQTRSVT